MDRPELRPPPGKRKAGAERPYLRPRLLPDIFRLSGVVCDAAAARASAEQAGLDATVNYNQANGDYTDDIARHNAAVAQWMQKQMAIFMANQAQFWACSGYMAAAFSHLDDEDSQVQSAWEHLHIGNEWMEYGDGLPADPESEVVAAYSQAQSHYGSTEDCNTVAGSRSASFRAAVGAAESIMGDF